MVVAIPTALAPNHGALSPHILLMGKLGPDGLYDLSQMTLLILELNLERVSKFPG